MGGGRDLDVKLEDLGGFFGDVFMFFFGISKCKKHLGGVISYKSDVLNMGQTAALAKTHKILIWITCSLPQ